VTVAAERQRVYLSDLPRKWGRGLRRARKRLKRVEWAIFFSETRSDSRCRCASGVK